jgi:hypothetical protein
VYGEVVEAGWLYLGVYSQLTRGGTVRLIDAANGNSLVEASYTTNLHAGGVPFSPLGVVPASILAFRNVMDGQLEKATDDLGRHLVEFIPDLAVTVQTKPQPAAHMLASVAAISDPPAQAEAANKPGVATLEVATAAPSASGTTVDKSQYRLQVASFRYSGEAERAVRRLQWKGYHPSVVEVKGVTHSWHRVLVGPFSSVEEAQKTRTRIQETLGFIPLMMQVGNN